MFTWIDDQNQYRRIWCYRQCSSTKLLVVNNVFLIHISLLLIETPKGLNKIVERLEFEQ